MLPDIKRIDLQWFNLLNTYESCQWYVLNTAKRSISLEELKKDTRTWLKKSGLIVEKPFYAM